MSETKTKTCVECDAVVSQWWEEDGDSYCVCCWSAMGRSCDGCWNDDCELCNGDDYECYCQECGEVIEGMTEEEFVEDDELKLCEECEKGE